MFVLVNVQRLLLFILGVCLLWYFAPVISLSCLFQTGVELETIDKMSLIEWLANNYKTFGEFGYIFQLFSSFTKFR